MSVQIDAVYQGSLGCTATHGPSGKTILTDAPVDNGGRGESFSPTDLVATALGTCILTILGLVADRHDLDLRGTTVRVEKEMTASPLRRIARLRTVVTYPAGLRLDAEDAQRLQHAANHCPVHASLHESIDAPIHFE